MTHSTPNPIRSLRPFIMGLALILAAGPTLADLTPAPELPGVSQLTKRPSAVGVTNQLTGEKGCHNEKTQTSEPGPCPKDY